MLAFRALLAFVCGSNAELQGCDAVRHSSWNALAASKIGKGSTILATTAQEYHGKHHQKALASNCTMDLHNNEIGATAGDGQLLPDDTPSWIHVMDGIFNSDLPVLFGWTHPDSIVEEHTNVLRFSNQDKIFNE